MRYYIIAGEASGDLHGSNLIKALKSKDSEASFRCWGGDLMRDAGGTVVRHIRDISFMGFLEVIKNIGKVIRNLSFCRKDIAAYNPDALILIDYPGFNLRMAKFAARQGIRVIYYISPKVWAWNQSRVRIIKKYVDRMLTIFPFETQFYEKHDYRVDYVGNPLLDAINDRSCKGESFDEFTGRNGLSGKPVIAILAGSRVQEIRSCLPVMLSVSQYFPDYQFLIAGAPSVERSIYNRFTRNSTPVLFNQTYSILQHSAAAMVVSGTATLEAALLNAPLIVCYRGSFLSYQIARRLISVRFISLVNLILDRESVRELIQDHFTEANLKNELDRLLTDIDYRGRMLNEFIRLRELLGSQGASARAAEIITGDAAVVNQNGIEDV